MRLSKVEWDGKRVTWTGVEGEIEAILVAAFEYGKTYHLKMDDIACSMGDAHDDREIVVEYK